jgi:hypothetical protein
MPGTGQGARSGRPIPPRQPPAAPSRPRPIPRCGAGRRWELAGRWHAGLALHPVKPPHPCQGCHPVKARQPCASASSCTSLKVTHQLPSWAAGRNSASLLSELSAGLIPCLPRWWPRPEDLRLHRSSVLPPPAPAWKAATMLGRTSAYAGHHYDVGSMSDRECPCLTLRSGTYRARASSSRTSGASGRLSVVAGSSVCPVAVLAGGCGGTLYLGRLTPACIGGGRDCPTCGCTGQARCRLPRDAMTVDHRS